MAADHLGTCLGQSQVLTIAAGQLGPCLGQSQVGSLLFLRRGGVLKFHDLGTNECTPGPILHIHSRAKFGQKGPNLVFDGGLVSVPGRGSHGPVDDTNCQNVGVITSIKGYQNGDEALAHARARII